MKKARKLVNPRFAKGKMYQQVMGEIAIANVCPFCPQHFKWHTKPILRRNKQWLITENFNSYENTSSHFLIIGEKHKEKFNQITKNDWIAITALSRWAIKKYFLHGGGLVLRFGDSIHTGATVAHLHFHLIVPQIKHGKAKTVWFPIG